MKTITIHNQKGGATKTALTTNLAHALALEGRRVLVVDTDPQGHTTLQFTELDKVKCWVRDYIDPDPGRPAKAPQQVRERLDLMGADEKLAAVEHVSNAEIFFALKEALEPFQDKYDYCLIDTPPSIGILPMTAMVASDGILYPVVLEPQVLSGLYKGMKTAGNTQKRLNPELKDLGIVVSNVIWNRTATKEFFQSLRLKFKGLVFENYIGTNIKVAEAWHFHKTVFEYDTDGRAIQQFKAIAQELMRRVNDAGQEQEQGQIIPVRSRPTGAV